MQNPQQPAGPLNPKVAAFVPKFNPNAPSFVPAGFTPGKPVVLGAAPAAAKPAAAPAATPAAAEKPAAAAEKTKVADSWDEEKKESGSASPAPLSVPSPVPSPAPKKESDADGKASITDAELKKELEKIAQEEKDDKADDPTADPREHLNIVFIGHVDAGKSTISGNILYLTGQVDKRTMEKYEKEAKENNRGTWFYAYIMDTIEEERAKGKTVEVGRAHFETAKKRYTILDAPGHKNFVPNMISGVAQADVGILVISAKTGEFESGFDKGGQTREHAMLAKTLGLKRLIIAVNKMDEPLINWSPTRWEEIKTKLGNFLTKEVGYAGKDSVMWVPISGYTGANLVEPLAPGVCSFYDGPALIPLLDSLPPIERNYTGPFRMPVVDKFKDMGVTYLLGKIEAGSVTKGQMVTIMPSKVTVKVAGIYVREEEEVKTAKAGESVRIGLTGCEENEVFTGYMLCDAKDVCKVSDTIIAQLVITELSATNPLFTAGYEAVIHIHTCVKECNVVDLLEEIDKKTRKPLKKKPTFVKSGAIVNVKLSLAAPICVDLFDAFPQLGRFTLRDKGKSIAVGKVVKIGA